MVRAEAARRPLLLIIDHDLDAQLDPAPAGWLFGTAIYPSGVAFLFPAVMTCAVGLVPPEERGSVLGTTSAFLDLGFGIGPVVLSLLAAGALGASGFAATFLVSAAALALMRYRAPAQEARR